MSNIERLMYEEYIESHKESPTYVCYRFKEVLCKVCIKLNSKEPCEILSCIDCNTHLFPIGFIHLTAFK